MCVVMRPSGSVAHVLQVHGLMRQRIALRLAHSICAVLVWCKAEYLVVHSTQCHYSWSFAISAAFMTLRRKLSALSHHTPTLCLCAVICKLAGKADMCACPAAQNLIRGRGLFCRSIMKSQMASPTYTPVFAALVAVVNTKFPEIGALLLHRLVLQARRALARQLLNPNPGMQCQVTALHICARRPPDPARAPRRAVLFRKRWHHWSVLVAKPRCLIRPSQVTTSGPEKVGYARCHGASPADFAQLWQVIVSVVASG